LRSTNILFYSTNDIPKPIHRHGLRFSDRSNCDVRDTFVGSAIVFGLGEAGIFPEPTEHIFEWAMWHFLLLWYYTFRFDMTKPGESFYIATVNEISPESHSAPLQGSVV